MKKKRTVIVEYKFTGDAELVWSALYTKDWAKWNSYYDEKGANDAISRCRRRFTWLDYRIKAEGENNGRIN